ncbi:MAG: 30S ribosomal protein S16 [Patescibacteria group bacterium]|nr:30S ribosomal protein S16 [Patescibacteria group bacterium]
MLKIRLTRIGKKNKPMYRLTVSEQSKDPYGQALDILGSYNPYSKELDCKKERIEYWLSKGAQMSPSVNNLLLNNEIIKGKKVKSFYPKKKDKGKEDEKKSADVEASENKKEKGN